MRKAWYALAAAVFAVATLASSAAAVPDSGKSNGPQGGPHDLGSPLSDKQRALRAVGLQKQLKGEIPKGAKVARIAKGQYVELAREGEDLIWTVLGEFGTQVNPTYGGTPGPLHNQIPEPDRNLDNTTIWANDFSESYYEDLLFDDAAGANSMRNYYKEQSSNRYTVDGDVTDWVTVPFNEANYGSNYCGGIVCARTWLFVQDSVNAWYQAQVAAGKTPAEIAAYLAQYDVWDRYDYDGDGNFDEPDGYVDHFQSIHAGEGEETGGGAQGTGAIWSHRWYAFYNNIGVTGPAFNKFGGIRIGGTDFWIGDYTIEPENGGVGVFAHEFAHDLGLPDEYDTSGNIGGAENSTGFWTLMSSGSYGNNGSAAEGIGNRPFHMNGWDKFVLGWLNYEVGSAGATSTHRLGPSATNTKQAQGVFVILPEKSVALELGAPYAGSKYYYSGNGNDLDNVMYKQVTLPAAASLTAQVKYQIELDWDYAYVVVSTNGGTTWQSVPTNRSTSTSPNGQNFGYGITGSSGGSWVPLTADLSAFSGQTVLVGFRYWTDGAAVEPGLMVDEISVAGQTYGAEGDDGFTLDGFRATTGSEIQKFNNYYLAENRQYLGYDAGLRTGPYNFGGAVSPDWAERFPYQDGVLVWYWDTSQSDNNVGDHPGEGLILPVDSHPEILTFADGTQMRPRLQAFDATFGLQRTDAIELYRNGVPTTVPSRPGVSTFDDTKSWWNAGHPSDAPGTARYQAEWNSVKVPNTGTQIRVVSEASTGFTQIEVRPAK